MVKEEDRLIITVLAVSANLIKHLMIIGYCNVHALKVSTSNFTNWKIVKTSVRNFGWFYWVYRRLFRGSDQSRTTFLQNPNWSLIELMWTSWEDELALISNFEKKISSDFLKKSPKTLRELDFAEYIWGFNT